MAELTSESELARVYDRAERIAVIGAHPDPHKPANYVPAYLQDQGFDVIPVNPGYLGEDIFGRKSVATVAEIDESVDVVQIFRRSEKVPEHIDQILALTPRPAVVWMQKGIRNDEVVAKLTDAGLDVVQDRCMMETHQELGLES